MIFLWAFPLWLIYVKRKSLILSRRTIELILLFSLLLLFLLAPQLVYKQLLMHRYFMPLIFILFIIAVSIVDDAKVLTQTFIVVTCLCMVSGFFWIYPDRISKGWDAMPLHYSYYQKRQDALRQISAMGIDKKNIGAAFPYNLSNAILDLTDDQSNFAELNLQKNEFILYSNISNDFQQSDIDELNSNWDKKFSCGTWPVRFILYQRRKK
jgi:hypothetical protein